MTAGPSPEPGRWEGLLDAVIGIGADLSLDGVLERIVSVACDVVGARYAALGVLGSGHGRRLRTFVQHGVSAEAAALIGPLPEGHGLLGEIIDHPEPLRLDDLGSHLRSYGFPEHHPVMHSFLGVPIRIKDRVFGNLYLTEKIDGGFTEQDERIVVALASAAGVAIENARLYEEAATRERWLAASTEIGTVLSTTDPLESRLEAVAARAAAEAGAKAAWLVGGPGPHRFEVRTVAPPGAPIHLVSAEVMRGVVRTRTAAVVDSAPALVVPVGAEGVLVLLWDPADTDRLHDLDPEAPTRYALQLAVGLELARAREEAERLTVFEDRDRIGRDLHDVVIQRLYAVGLSLQSLDATVTEPDARRRLDTAVDDLDATIRDIRRTIFALGSPDDAADIMAEVTRLVDRAAATLKFRPTLRFQGPVRALVGPELAPDVLAVLGEALSNAAKHAAAHAVTVVLEAGDAVTLMVEDDGRGLPDGVVESGLSNIRERAERHGGRLTMRSGPESGTTLEWTVPLR